MLHVLHISILLSRLKRAWILGIITPFNFHRFWLIRQLRYRIVAQPYGVRNLMISLQLIIYSSFLLLFRESSVMASGPGNSFFMFNLRLGDNADSVGSFQTRFHFSTPKTKENLGHQPYLLHHLLICTQLKMISFDIVAWYGDWIINLITNIDWFGMIF